MVCTRISSVPCEMSQRRKFSNTPLTPSVLNSIRPQKVIQSTFQTPVADPYGYARMPSPSGICQTQAARMKVTIDPISTASQAETRYTASNTSSSTTGIRAIRQVRPRLPTGSTICVNILPPIRSCCGRRNPQDEAATNSVVYSDLEGDPRCTHRVRSWPGWRAQPDYRSDLAAADRLGALTLGGADSTSWQPMAGK